MQGTQYATKRSILCRGAFCGPTVRNINDAHRTHIALKVSSVSTGDYLPISKASIGHPICQRQGPHYTDIIAEKSSPLGCVRCFGKTFSRSSITSVDTSLY